jgi:DMSO/TMAO reductase YedYZ molybdopterin-dependent catalytic subunit
MSWAAGAAAGQELTLHGLDGRTRTLSAAQIAAMPRRTAILTPEGGGAPRRFEGPALSDLVQSVGAPAGSALRGPALADIVVVRGADGYRAAFALAELDPGMRNETVILADTVDGGPLPASQAPFRLVAEGDGRQARSVRMVVDVTLEAAP